MKLAIMQPYLFPYVGYFQLIASVEKFIFFDDVNFITRGYIHRNNILNDGNRLTFTVPIKKSSQNRLIRDTEIQFEEYKKWKNRFEKTISQNYGSAPFYGPVRDLLNEVLENPSKKISFLAMKSVMAVSKYLSLDTEFGTSSAIPYRESELAQEKILEICEFLGATTYINPLGGKELYDFQSFKKQNLSLYFLKSENIEYWQNEKEFVPNLSIIDVLMFNDQNTVRNFLSNYSLIGENQKVTQDEE